MKYTHYTLADLAKIKYGKNQKKVLSELGNIPIYGTGVLKKSVLVSAIMHNKAIFDQRTTFIPFYENVLKEGIDLWIN